MAVQPTYPGVYIQEVPSGVRTIAGVSTSIAMFVGRTERGIMDRPTRVFNFTEFKEKFGDGTQESEMAHQVRQFFQNGGSQAYVMRIAKGASQASVDLNNEIGEHVLTATAKETGKAGERIRIEVDYDTPEPDKTFNMRVFRFVENGAGGFSEEDVETHENLTMNPDGGRYAPTYVTQGSSLIDLGEPDPIVREASASISVSGRIIQDGIDAGLNRIISGEGDEEGEETGKTRLRIHLGQDSRELDLSGVSTGETPLVQQIATLINNEFGITRNQVRVQPLAVAVTDGDFTGNALKITYPRDPDVPHVPRGDVAIAPAEDPETDFGTAMRLGAGQGGIEVGRHAVRRPAPSGLFFQYGPSPSNPDAGDYFENLFNFGTSQQDSLRNVTVTPSGGDGETIGGLNLVTTNSGDPMLRGQVATDTTPDDGDRRDGFLDNIREKFQELIRQFNEGALSLSDFDWTLSLQGMRLVFKPTAGEANAGRATTVGPASIGDPLATNNTRYYSIGPGGTGNFQANGSAGSDGSKPKPETYGDAYRIIAREVDLFNLLILPRDGEQDDSERANLWPRASTFAQEQRAFLLVDPPKSWTSANEVTRGTPRNIGTMRRGLVKDHAGIFWPRLKIVDPKTGLDVFIDPSGTIAGVAARIDRTRGVWKAFAGIEADLRLVRGVQYSMSDAENGVINQQAANAVRVFPNGVVSWGGRTIDGFDGSGNIDYRYIPVRRLALFIEESLYRGLKWVVFEPNDESLWAQIRLAVGGFMQDLFRQGAFQGTKPKDAYFVKVDSETTIQRDINLGRVNIWVGFAPVRPAEFVILYLQQMAGQGQS